MANVTTPQVLVQSLRPALIEGMAQKLPVLIRVQAPDRLSEAEGLKQAERLPYHIALVIDRSGSMSGPPLQEAIRCARHVVERMQACDCISLVTFDDTVRTLVPAQPIGDRSALNRALESIREGGSTNLCGGWQAGADSLKAEAREAGVARVIMLSDGNANVGEQRDEVIAGYAAAAAELGVSTSTYGLGHQFNENLMVSMARRGGGNHYYGATAADLFEPFAQEFDFLSSLYARQLNLRLQAPAGVRIMLLNQYAQHVTPDGIEVRLPDLALQAEAWALVELEIPARLAGAQTNLLLQATVSAVDVEGMPLTFNEYALALPGLPTQAWSSLLVDELVAARQAEITTGQLIGRAREAAARGKWEEIDRIIEQAQRDYAGYPWLSEVLVRLGEISKEKDAASFQKVALYACMDLSSRLTAKDENIHADSCADLDLPAFVRRKREQGKAQFEPD